MRRRQRRRRHHDVEATLWNLGRARGGFEYPVLALACGAPTLAAIVLWGARRHRLNFD